MKLLDGKFIEPTSQGGELWQKLMDGEQVKFLEATKGQDVFDLLKIGEKIDDKNIGAWIGSLALSTSKGMPDDYTLDVGDMREAIYQVQECLIIAGKNLPIMVDLDACYGNPLRAFAMLNVMHVAAGVTENKRADIVKVNSLVSGKKDLSQMASLESMALRLKKGKTVQKNTLVAVRLENLIYGMNPKDTVDYLMEIESLTDLVLLHWKDEDPSILLETAQYYRKTSQNPRPIIGVTTKYGKNTKPSVLLDKGVQILIYPNQLTRKNLYSAQEVYEKLLTDGTAGGGVDGHVVETKEVIQRFSEPGTFTYNRTL